MPAVAWAALADPSRRRVLELLLERPRAVGELVEAIDASQPSTSKHLRVLRDAGLVAVTGDAQRRIYSITPGPLEALDEWLAPYRALWADRLDALGAHLDATDPAVPTSDTASHTTDKEE